VAVRRDPKAVVSVVVVRMKTFESFGWFVQAES